MKFRILTLLWMLLIAPVSLMTVGPIQAQSSIPKVPPSMATPRGVVLEWSSAESQPYWYRLPKKIDAKSPPRLIFMLHGTGLDHRWSFANYAIKSGKFRGNDIVISPDGLTKQGETFNFVQGKQDGDQILGLIQMFQERFPISEVYIYGHSQGAFFAYWFAGEHPQWVDGIVAHAGNVLGNVKHSDLARRKIGIGILHGKADVVVPVSCAEETAEVYKAKEYKKINLNIVDGLTERSGHWPLPDQVSEMLLWLDQATQSDPGVGIGNAVSELSEEEPSLLIVQRSIVRTQRALKSPAAKKLPRDERKKIETNVELIEGFLETAGSTQSEAILGQWNADPDAVNAPWIGHFKAMQSSLGETKAWGKALRKISSAAKKQNSNLGRASKFLAGPVQESTFKKSVGVLLGSPLAASSDDFGKLLLQIADESSFQNQSVDELKQFMTDAETASNEGQTKANELTQSVIQEFRTANPEIFNSEQ